LFTGQPDSLADKADSFKGERRKKAESLTLKKLCLSARIPNARAFFLGHLGNNCFSSQMLPLIRVTNALCIAKTFSLVGKEGQFFSNEKPNPGGFCITPRNGHSDLGHIRLIGDYHFAPQSGRLFRGHYITGGKTYAKEVGPGNLSGLTTLSCYRGCTHLTFASLHELRPFTATFLTSRELSAH